MTDSGISEAEFSDDKIEELYRELVTRLVATHEHIFEAMNGDEDTRLALAKVAAKRATAASDDSASTQQQKAVAHAAVTLVVIGRPV
jgi:hypothetical protein